MTKSAFYITYIHFTFNEINIMSNFNRYNIKISFTGGKKLDNRKTFYTSVTNLIT